MPTLSGLNAWNAGPTERRNALVTIATIAVAASVVALVAARPLPASFPLFAMILSASTMGLTMTGLLLVFHARAMRSPATMMLASGYLLAAAMLLCYAVTVAGMFPPFVALIGATAATNTVFWLAWRVVLLGSMIAFLTVRHAGTLDEALRVRARTFVTGLPVTFAVIVAIALWAPGIPPMAVKGAWTPFFLFFLVPVVVVLAIVVVANVARRLDDATTLELGLGVIAFAIGVEVVLQVLGGAPFTIGWYAARLTCLFATNTALSVLLRRESYAYAGLMLQAQALQSEAYTDTLTGLANRRRFDEEYARAFGSALRRDATLAVAIVDIDRFKLYNDAFGHQKGDVALRGIANAIAESAVRSGDFAARYGGEEFVVVLEDTNGNGAVEVAERIRNTVIAAGIVAPGDQLLTVSVGVATRRSGDTPEDVLRHADEALYRAKGAGRNRVVVWNPPLELTVAG